jgi:hypothetical protein
VCEDVRGLFLSPDPVPRYRVISKGAVLGRTKKYMPWSHIVREDRYVELICGKICSCFLLTAVMSTFKVDDYVA